MFMRATCKAPAYLIKVFYISCRPLSIFLSIPNSPSLSLLSNAILFPLLVIMGTLLSPTTGWAWEVKTHEELTEEAIETVEMDLNTYLVENLGLESGLNESLSGGTPRVLMKLGSRREDDPIRFLNHFHNPILNSGLRLSDSAIKWSLSGVGEQEWSWNDAREYYFKALTSEAKGERDENWGKTFRALGQVMHLLQDSANPAHVREDTHLLLDGLHDFMARQSVGSYLGGGAFSPDPSMLEEAGPAGPNGEPFANLFDRDTYQGSAPEATLGTDIGVTEYTNANFFSDDTIPGQDSTEFVHPNLSELVPAPTVPFGPQYLTLPRLGSPTELKARVAKFTGSQSFAKFRLAGLQLDLLNQLRLDDLVYEAYSSNLIPRAVGYSAAVLTYFFRNQLPITSHKFFVAQTVSDQNECIEVPLLETGDFVVKMDIPSSWSFNGTAFLYYEESDERRVLLDEDPNASSGEVSLQGVVPWSKTGLEEPVQWYVVLQGEVGPGVVEPPQAIVATQDEAPWEWVCVFEP